MSIAQELIEAVIADIKSDIGTGRVTSTCSGFVAISVTINRPCYKICPVGEVCKNFNDIDIDAKLREVLSEWQEKLKKVSLPTFSSLRIRQEI